jgi:hypothetical protein
MVAHSILPSLLSSLLLPLHRVKHFLTFGCAVKGIGMFTDKKVRLKAPGDFRLQALFSFYRYFR